MNAPFADASPTGIRRSRLLLASATIAMIWLTALETIHAEETSSSARLEADVTLLAEDSMQGRGIGTAGLDRAAEFIAERFEELGLDTDLIDGGPFQLFQSSTRVPKVDTRVDWEAINAAKAGASAKPAPEADTPPRGASTEPEKEAIEEAKRPERRSVEAKNVMALLLGKGPLANEIIVVGAHYDHLGYREKNGRATVFNGANDNASGTAALLEIARILSRRGERLPRSVLFIAFSAEERGLVGSFFYIKHPVVPTENTVAMVNLDMVGCMEDEQVMACGSGTSKLLAKMVIRAAHQHDLNLIEMPGRIGGSDHVPFYSHEIPVVHFITTNGWKYYHKPTDDVETLDFEGVARISAMTADLVVALAESEKRPKFQDRGWGDTIVRNLFRFMGAAASAMAEPERK